MSYGVKEIKEPEDRTHFKSKKIGKEVSLCQLNCPSKMECSEEDVTSSSTQGENEKENKKLKDSQASFVETSKPEDEEKPSKEKSIILKTLTIKVPGFVIKLPIHKHSHSKELVSQIVLPESLEWLRTSIEKRVQIEAASLSDVF